MGAGPSTAGPVKASVDAAIAQHVVTIFSKTYCPVSRTVYVRCDRLTRQYCTKAKKTIADQNVDDVKIIE